MTRIAFFIGLCLSFPAAVALADEDKAIAEAAKALQGTWELRGAEMDSQAGVIKQVNFKFAGRHTYGKDGAYKIEIMGKWSRREPGRLSR